MKKKASVKHKMHQKSKERKSLKEKRSKRHMPQKRQLQEKPELLLKGKTVPPKTLDAKSIVQLLEYKTLFGSIWKPTPSIEKLLSKVSRERAIKIACLLNNLYGEADIIDLNSFFSSTSINNRNIVNEKLKKYANTKTTNLRILWTTSETPLQLLRTIFSMPSSITQNDSEDNEEAEMAVFKAILLLNQRAMEMRITEKDKNYENLLFLLSALNINMQSLHEEERKSRTIMQEYFAVKFFKFLENEPKYEPIYKAFISKHKSCNWQEYIRSVFGIVVALNYKSGFIEKDFQFDQEHLINKDIIESLCIPYNKTIAYSSQSPQDREGNTDYRAFRNSPIIKMQNGNYCVHSWKLMIDRLFNALYFEFRNLEIPEKLTKQIPSLFTDIFSEKILFDSLLEETIDPKVYTKASEDDMRKKHKKKDDELGPPDYLLVNNNACIIFECKDVRIGGDEFESHDFNKIIDIYSNKLNWKRWKYDNDGNIVDLTENGHKQGKHIGVSQITYHMSNIRKSKFEYYEIDSDKKIYPVLILSDYKYILPGLTKIANKWYQEDLGNIFNSSLDMPLIVMSFITLIKYGHLFKRHGFEFYFERYYKKNSMEPVTNFDTLYNANQSFDEYMSNYPYNLTELSEELSNVIKYDRGNN